MPDDHGASPPPKDSKTASQGDAAKQARKQERYDLFVLEKQYPDVSHLLNVHPALAEIAGKATFVLDTNALLTPFLIGQSGLEDITKVLRKLAGERRLFVPARVLREFARNRDGKLRDLYTGIQQRIDKGIEVPALANSPFEVSESYQAAAEKRTAVLKAFSEYRAELVKLRDEVKEWRWNDPVSRLYRDVFNSDGIIDHKLTDEALTEDLRRRNQHRIPPGFGDEAKDDEGIGDVAIWHSIIEHGRSKSVDVIFVTNERSKGDWTVTANKVALFPRFELGEEFHRVTGRNFSLVDFHAFLKIAGASEQTVQEAANAEVVSIRSLGMLNIFAADQAIGALRTFAKFARDIVSGNRVDADLVVDVGYDVEQAVSSLAALVDYIGPHNAPQIKNVLEFAGKAAGALAFTAADDVRISEGINAIQFKAGHRENLHALEFLAKWQALQLHLRDLLSHEKTGPGEDMQ